MSKVFAPNKQYSGISAGVAFANGVGETTDPHLISWFKDHGYEIEEVPEVETDEETKKKNAGKKAE